MGFPGSSDGKESTCNVGDLGSITGLGWSTGGGHGNLLQYSYLENPHGQRSLVGHGPCSHKESVTAEKLSTHTHTHTHSPVITKSSSIANLGLGEDRSRNGRMPWNVYTCLWTKQLKHHYKNVVLVPYGIYLKKNAIHISSTLISE